jgi:hypothetical protein
VQLSVLLLFGSAKPKLPLSPIRATVLYKASFSPGGEPPSAIYFRPNTNFSAAVSTKNVPTKMQKAMSNGLFQGFRS